MKRILLLALAVGLPLVAAAEDRWFKAPLHGYREVPSISTSGSGTFIAHMHSDHINYQLSYSRLQGNVTQAHLHFGQYSVNGGVAVFLCSNLAGAPAGTPPCPAPPATITGTITAGDVIGPAAQGISPGEYAELVRAIKAGKVYANVHSSLHPSGEIRSQLYPYSP
jgi:hypothetical protein